MFPHEVTLSLVQTFVFGRLSVCVCQAVMTVSSSPAFQHIYHSPKFVVNQKCDENAYHALFHVVNENIHHSIQPWKQNLEPPAC